MERYIYSTSVSPLRRGRRKSSNTPAESSSGFETATSLLNSFTSSVFNGASKAITKMTPQLNGDYQVLKQSVEKQRLLVREARSELASNLDRLGEHHVRNKEYDDAMDAFTEALSEKRSVYSQLLPPLIGDAENRSSCNSSQEPLEGESLLDGSVMTDSDSNQSELREQTIDDIVQTLRNMGNVHSLRGEQDEAMRYYSEVTSLRASRSCNRGDSASTSSTIFSGGTLSDEDNSAFMSELNEDVRALDDLFRSISFRNGELRDVGVTRTVRENSTKPLGQSDTNRKRRRGNTESIEAEPFKREASESSQDRALFTSMNDEVREALDLYRSVIESYTGQNLDMHDEKLNSFALRADIVHHNKNRLSSQADSKNKGAKGESREEELNLALEVYKCSLSAQEEMMSDPLQDSDSEPQSPSKIASTLIRMGSLYYKLNNVDEELRMYKEAKAIYKLTFGDNHPYVAGTRKNIGMVLAERGEYEASINQFEKARKIYLSLNNGNENTRDVASAYSCMGNVKNRMGELDDALNQYMQALHIYKAILQKVQEEEGADHINDAVRDAVASLKIIGMVRAKKGELDTAMEFFNEAMTLLRASSANNMAASEEGKASILTRIACIHYKKGEYEKAMTHYQEAYDLATSVHGTTNHPDIASILHYIGGINHKFGKSSEAMSCYQEAVRIYHATLGPGNPAVATTLVCIGSIHYKKRNLDSAMMFYREAFRLNRDAYGLHHPDVAPTLKSIGMILAKKGDYDEAYDVFRDVLSIKCTVHGMGHPEVANAYKSLGNLHYKRGELADAEREYRHALSIYRRAKGEDHADTLAARTTIEHLRQHMRERGQRRSHRNRGSSSRSHRSERSHC